MWMWMWIRRPCWHLLAFLPACLRCVPPGPDLPLPDEQSRRHRARAVPVLAPAASGRFFVAGDFAPNEAPLGLD